MKIDGTELIPGQAADQQQVITVAINVIKAMGAEINRLADKYEPHPELPDDNSFTLSDLYGRGLDVLNLLQNMEARLKMTNQYDIRINEIQRFLLRFAICKALDTYEGKDLTNPDIEELQALNDMLRIPTLKGPGNLNDFTK